ncbi:hypothetical protein CIN_18470 [Commensalibacter intestini A911]|uniref:Uncharacterized protein n=1 Tax=Commensalibacter intestini A911 TaxID=1088868 RepID=G6F2K1_9PROT|nr:hypothetical protein [Commensalibacter intestini]EHD13110.1 hypothetical protein CIN_18470 [Commensalibacter intestini A911]
MVSKMTIIIMDNIKKKLKDETNFITLDDLLTIIGEMLQPRMDDISLNQIDTCINEGFLENTTEDDVKGYNVLKYPCES